MKISYKVLSLELKFPFSIAKFSRTSTAILLLKLEYEGCFGLGEASMVPYMGENPETAVAFLNKVDFSSSVFSYPFQMQAILNYLDSIEMNMPAVKAAIDIALHDITGKIQQKPCYKLYDAQPKLMPLTSYTIGIDSPDIIIKKVEDALSYDFKLLKIKLGRDSDRLLIDTIRLVTDLPLYVDANQGWEDKYEGVEMTHWLKEQGVILIEQPMVKENIDDNAWITDHSPIPIIADEAVQRLSDIDKVKGAYHGINIKLMKSAGMYEAHQMLIKAKESGLKIMIGCMSETSVATLAGAALAPLCDFVDLDGPFMTKNNPYNQPYFISGKYKLSDLPGLGVIDGENS